MAVKKSSRFAAITTLAGCHPERARSMGLRLCGWGSGLDAVVISALP
jgi:hypothetical protein